MLNTSKLAIKYRMTKSVIKKYRSDNFLSPFFHFLSLSHTPSLSHSHSISTYSLIANFNCHIFFSFNCLTLDGINDEVYLFFYSYILRVPLFDDMVSYSKFSSYQFYNQFETKKKFPFL